MWLVNVNATISCTLRQDSNNFLNPFSVKSSGYVSKPADASLAPSREPKGQLIGAEPRAQTKFAEVKFCDNRLSLAREFVFQNK